MQSTQITNQLLTESSTATPLVKITYKDKKELELDPRGHSFEELANYFDRHSRQLQIKETIENQ
ncbi:hypothetical protein J7297_05174 [Nakaseomyces glabratus]|nr:hypothetical protein J7297_05174 [Nakaseomyces glabratus]KAH7579772.1 hypothetical protein J7298_05171 [Nakaseomyces glabratus]KAH7580397.1 hypothetical protein J7296_05151 [Nakaseomyces glabratus]KAH7592953.1 hypothetical protein J7295_05166 [Nakaseomyces glabratus]KAH7594024.1 hypothetical protein J7294_05169 [Nakaseomyces glabratus]